MTNLLQIIKKSNFNIEKFDFSKFSEQNSVAFLGSPISHPYDEAKFILICDPISEHTEFIEFSKRDLTNMEHLTNIQTELHETVNMFRVWIKTGSTGVKYNPFVVTKTRNDILNLLSVK